MRRILATIFCLLLTAGVVFAQPVPPGTGGPGLVTGSKVGYPRQCCDDATDPTACEWETCAEMRAGAGPVTPAYFRLLDIDSALGLDLTRLQYTLGGMTNLQLRVVPTMSTMFALNAAGDVFFPLRLDASFRLITSIQDPLDINGNVMTAVYSAGAGGWTINLTGEADFDLEMINGNAINTNGGATDAGTQTVVPATDSPGLTTAAPGYSREQDGDSAVLKDVFDAVSDGLSLSLNWGASASVTLLYNGATLDMARSGATGGMQVETVNFPNAYDFGNAWIAGLKKETAVSNPAVTSGTAVTDASAVVCASTYVLNLPNWSVWVKNAGGGAADALTDVDVQISYDGANWWSETSTACDTLVAAASARCYKGSNESAAYVQVIADVAAADTTTVDCVVQGNKN